MVDFIEMIIDISEFIQVDEYRFVSLKLFIDSFGDNTVA
jgi:hypothetical protein